MIHRMVGLSVLFKKKIERHIIFQARIVSGRHHDPQQKHTADNEIRNSKYAMNQILQYGKYKKEANQ